MPSQSDVESLMRARLTNDSAGQMAQAAEFWKELQLGFFYQDVNAAQIAAAEVAVAAAAMDNRILTNSILANLQKDIQLPTAVKKAIIRIFVATFVPEPM